MKTMMGIVFHLKGKTGFRYIKIGIYY